MKDEILISMFESMFFKDFQLNNLNEQEKNIILSLLDRNLDGKISIEGFTIFDI